MSTVVVVVSVDVAESVSSPMPPVWLMSPAHAEPHNATPTALAIRVLIKPPEESPAHWLWRPEPRIRSQLPVQNFLFLVTPAEPFVLHSSIPPTRAESNYCGSAAPWDPARTLREVREK